MLTKNLLFGSVGLGSERATVSTVSTVSPCSCKVSLVVAKDKEIQCLGCSFSSLLILLKAKDGAAETKIKICLKVCLK